MILANEFISLGFVCLNLISMIYHNIYFFG